VEVWLSNGEVIRLAFYIRWHTRNEGIINRSGRAAHDAAPGDFSIAVKLEHPEILGNSTKRLSPACYNIPPV
jgi:hypothetical protein